MKSIKAYWWRERPNFGDGLAPHLLKRFANVQPTWATVSRADVASVGSVLEHIPPLWHGDVLGCGKLFSDSRLHCYNLEGTVWALRGPLSASGIKGDFAIGDPGLLADELISDDIETRKYDLGILPHWSDVELQAKPEWYGNHFTTKVIYPTSDPLQVVREIAQCKKLVTSSLHGLIVADACGIPRRLEHCKALDRDGGSFKFFDYSKSVNAPMEFGRTITASRFHVEDRKHEIYDAYEAFGQSTRRT
jgi:pyruvyltransferase